MNVAVLGGGRMGEALAAGLIEAGWDADRLAVAEVDAGPSAARSSTASAVCGSCPARPGRSPTPKSSSSRSSRTTSQVRSAPCGAALGADTLVLSLAAGVTIAALESAAPGRPVVRAMPNTGALVGRGAAADRGGDPRHRGHLELAEQLLGSVGLVVRVPEHLLDAVTGLSGSGPAYVFLLAEAMTEAGVLVGLPRDVAATLVHQTLLGAATLLATRGPIPEALRAAVTSPGGTTAAGLLALETHGVRAAVLDAVTAATERSRELGRQA